MAKKPSGHPAAEPPASTNSAATLTKSTTRVMPTGGVPHAAPAESTANDDRAPHATAKNPQPGSDPFLAAVGSLRDLIQHAVSTSTWSFALACAFGGAIRLVPLLKEDTITSGLLFLCAISVGALIGRQLDRRRRRARSRSGPRRWRRRRATLAVVAVVMLALVVIADVLLRWLQ
jgi:hypothetical protein